MSWTNVALLQRLVTRFNLNLQPQLSQSVYPVKFRDEIVPITDADKLLKVIIVESGATGSNPGGGGEALVASVPVGKRWRVIQLNVARTAGAGTINSLYVRASGVLLILARPAAVTEVLYQPTTEFILDARSTISVNVVDAGASSFRADYLVEAEDAY